MVEWLKDHPVLYKQDTEELWEQDRATALFQIFLVSLACSVGTCCPLIFFNTCIKPCPFHAPGIT